MIAPDAIAFDGIRLPRWLLTIALVTLGVTFVAFVNLTQPARFACGDDVAFQVFISAGEVESHFVEEARNQGRFYLAAPIFFPPWQLYLVSSSWLFSTIRAAFLFLQFGLLGWFAARLARNAALGWMIALAAAAGLHLPATFFAALSFPEMWIGFSALLGSLHLHLTHLRRGSPAAAAVSGVLLLFACLNLETYIVFTPLFAALSWQHGRRAPLALLRSLAPQIAAAAGYVLVYVAFTRVYPSDYAGTQISLQPGAALQVLLRMSLSIVPGFELFIHRTHPAGGGALWKSAPEIGSILRGVGFANAGLALLQAGAVVALAAHATRGIRAARGWVGWALVCIFLPNLPVALTAKYQTWVYQRAYPYTYGFYSYCALVVAAVFLWQWFAARTGERAARPGLFLLGTACLVLFLTAKASNLDSIALLQRWFNERPPA